MHLSGEARIQVEKLKKLNGVIIRNAAERP